MSLLRNELYHCQASFGHHPMDESLRIQEGQLIKEFLAACKGEESMLRQESRIQWLKLGEQNSKFFHRSIKSRINKKKTVQIEDEFGNTFSSYSKVVSTTVNHFQNLLGSGSPSASWDSSISNDLFFFLVNEIALPRKKKGLDKQAEKYKENSKQGAALTT